MCGEHITYKLTGATSQGSSPHVRGTQCRVTDLGDGDGIIPACAGNTGIRAQGRVLARDHPRMCGEHPVTTPVGETEAGSSPHVRGTQPVPADLDALVGIIPACAGNTASQRLRQS